MIIIQTDRSINVGGNVIGNINTGDNVSQNVFWGTKEDGVFNNLLEEIKQNSSISKDEANEAIEILQHLKHKKANNTLTTSFLKKMWSLLPETIRLMGAAAEMFKIFSNQ